MGAELGEGCRTKDAVPRMIDTLRLAFLLYLIYNAISNFYYAGKGELKMTLSRASLGLNGAMYFIIAMVLIIL